MAIEKPKFSSVYDNGAELGTTKIDLGKWTHTVDTTDATATNIATFDIDTDALGKTLAIDAVVVGKVTGGTAGVANAAVGYRVFGAASNSTRTFTVSGVTTDPTAGAVYRINGVDHYVISESGTPSTSIVMTRPAGAVLPASGTMTKQSGTGDATITYSAYTEDVAMDGNEYKTVEFEYSSLTGCAVDMDVSSGVARLRVTGIANTNITWYARVALFVI